MTRDEVLATITQLVRTEINPNLVRFEVQPEHNLRDDLYLDSLNLVTLSVAIEDTFDIIFDPVQMDLVAIFDTVESLADFIVHWQSTQSVNGKK